MYARLVLVSLLSAAAAFPSATMTHECLLDIQNKYAGHLRLLKVEPHDHTAIMKKVMEQIDPKKCANVQIKMLIGNADQVDPKEIPDEPNKTDEVVLRDDDKFFVERFDGIKRKKQDLDVFIMKVKDPEKHITNNRDNRQIQKNYNYGQDSGRQQSYITTDNTDETYKNKKYGNGYYYDQDASYLDETDNSRQQYNRRNTNYQNTNQPYYTQRRKWSNNQRQKYDGQDESNVNYNSKKQNVAYDTWDYQYYNERQADAVQDSTDKVINQSESESQDEYSGGDDGDWVDDSNESDKIPEETTKTEVGQANDRYEKTTNRYYNQQNYNKANTYDRINESTVESDYSSEEKNKKYTATTSKPTYRYVNQYGVIRNNDRKRPTEQYYYTSDEENSSQAYRNKNEHAQLERYNNQTETNTSSVAENKEYHFKEIQDYSEETHSDEITKKQNPQNLKDSEEWQNVDYTTAKSTASHESNTESIVGQSKEVYNGNLENPQVKNTESSSIHTTLSETKQDEIIYEDQTEIYNRESQKKDIVSDTSPTDKPEFEGSKPEIDSDPNVQNDQSSDVPEKQNIQTENQTPVSNVAFSSQFLLDDANQLIIENKINGADIFGPEVQAFITKLLDTLKLWAGAACNLIRSLLAAGG